MNIVIKTSEIIKIITQIDQNGLNYQDERQTYRKLNIFFAQFNIKYKKPSKKVLKDPSVKLISVEEAIDNLMHFNNVQKQIDSQFFQKSMIQILKFVHFKKKKQKKPKELKQHEQNLISNQTTLGKQRNLESLKILEQLSKIPQLEAEVMERVQNKKKQNDELLLLSETQQQIPKISKKCYICKKIYTQVHHFYYSLCQKCGDLNYEKRTEAKPDLKGKIAVVTGARIKVGFYITLILLRNGCEVHATSRFIKDALERYKKEPDFDQFKDRLFLYSLDFRNMKSVKEFCDYLNQILPKLDILINNAAQTVRRNDEYYKGLLDIENKPLSMYSPEEINIFSNNIKLQQLSLTNNSFVPLPLTEDSHSDSQPETNMFEQQTNDLSSTIQNNQIQNFNSSSLMTLGSLIGKVNNDPNYPEGVLNQYGLQYDISTMNSWVMKLDNVPFFEFMETQVINSWAPFMFCQDLKNLMIKTPEQLKTPKFIVNVSAVEGQFERYNKSPYHPHTNMAKAQLNMLTRTSGKDYAKNYNIFMTSADTGWVSNDMIPLNILSDNYHNQVPIDEWDGAYRVLDPIFQGLITGKPLHSVFLQHYQIAKW